MNRAGHPSAPCDAQPACDTRTELQARREKLAYFDRQCSRVSAGLFLGSDTVARSRDALRSTGITHVVNCVGALYPAYFADELRYLVLHLQGAPVCVLLLRALLLKLICVLGSALIWHMFADTPAEDILAVAFDVFDFIEARPAWPPAAARALHRPP